MVNLFASPLWFSTIDPTIRDCPIRTAAVKGLILYFAIAWIDGAIEYIPVMAFYWFVMAVAIYGGRLTTTAEPSSRGAFNKTSLATLA